MLTALVVGAGALTAPQAALALRLAPCRVEPSFSCGELRVPLDHRGAVRGTLRLAVAAQRDYPRGAGLLVALSGGPGQSSVDAAGSFAMSLDPLLRDRRLVVLDQRGTGRSGALDCPGLQRLRALDPFTPEAVAECAARIGPHRAFYRTADTVEDIEALRRAFGAKRIALMGISYGTWVAQEYARAHPGRTAALVLDSVVGPQPPDGFYLDTYRNLPRVLREQCAERRCDGATTDPVGDLGAVAQRLRAGPLSGTVFDASGRARTASLHSEEELSFLVTAADLNPFMQARLPGALAAARAGDPAALLRLRRIAQGPRSPASELSFGLNVVTGCQDAALPYSLGAAPAARAALASAALAAIPPSDYAPWSAEAVRSSSYVDDCLLFPATPAPAPSSGPLPSVPTLLLAGRLDVRTPLENARDLKALVPGAQLVAVPGNGHDVVDTDATGCASVALRRFAAGRAVGDPCRDRSDQVGVPPRPPVSLAAVRPAPGVSGERGRVLRAALASVEEARFSVLEALWAGVATRGGGLRGGSYGERGLTVTLREYSYVPGVRLSGRLALGRGATGTVRVRGRVSGTLRVRDSGAAAGVLGGRQVRWRSGGALGSAAVARRSPAVARRSLLGALPRWRAVSGARPRGAH